ncbi:MAG: hypothetical protein LBC74_02005, partial [Planctomycetaceae bacterium]|nr:hypothetical protein [Planctomycetaceae bacterium]
LTCRRPPLTTPKNVNYSPPADGLVVVSERLRVVSEGLNAIFRCRFFVALMYFWVREKVYSTNKIRKTSS